ncbi:MAG: hypothetical protein CMM01_10600 [Rhodopirellula sp.]|nr:hypothetical protein [Rhodopirellula sp.]MAI71351.1 hypothetical protein [Rhodopirellula sp.]
MDTKQAKLLTVIHAAVLHFPATQRISWIVLTLFLWMLCAPGFTMGQNSLVITPTGNEPKGFAHVFSRKVDVFGVSVFATHDTQDKKLLHAANVLAQYLDNDADGTPDNKPVLKALKEHHGAVVMFATEQTAMRVDIHQHIPEGVWDRMVLVGLFGEETHPGGAADGVFDATYEEVLHLITSAGYAHAYPRIFGEKRGTKIANAMDKARGGHFNKVPAAYPRKAWYTYYDQTCDYRCQITEYIYWGITSLLGAQDFPNRLEEISEEWRWNTPAKVKSGDPDLYALLSDPKYSFPTKLPDGKYEPQVPSTSSSANDQLR